MKQQLEDYKKRFLESDDKFETIFNLTSAPSKIINSDLTIIKVNNAVTELLGFTAEEIEGTKILDYACPEFIAHWHQLQDALWSRKMPFFKLDACLIRKDKSVAWVNVTTVLFNQNNETFGFTVLEDITAKKQLEESKKRLDMALEYSKIAVWEINLNDFSVIRSKSHDGIFGYENPLVFWTKDTYRQHLLPEDFPEFEQAIASAKEKNGIDYKGRIYTVKKVLKWIHLQGKIEQDREVNLLKIIGTVKDITQEKVAEKHKDEFISTVSHELKTPITSIKAQTQILERKFFDTDDSLTATMLKRINTQINRLSSLVSDLLEAGQIGEQQQLLRREEYFFNEMVEDIVAEIQRTTFTHQIIIEKNPQVSFLGDRERTSQVLSNLLSNAIKYSSGQDKVIVKVDVEDQNLICSVIDFGLGIPVERQAHLFERFYRVPADNNYKVSGFGLGLYISAEIIKRLHGKIWLSSTPGKGSAFSFSLPIKHD